MKKTMLAVCAALLLAAAVGGRRGRPYIRPWECGAELPVE